MCGIVGVVSSLSHSRLPSIERLSVALNSLQHRGPDRSGDFNDGRVWLGHNRLSIIDLTEGGAQPMHSASGRLVITYNGEVYNYRELAAKHALGPMRSTSDTEVVLQLFEKLGKEAFRELNGIFAFCIYDKQAGKLWLVRDRLGVKPLYYCANSEGLIFASEVKAILSLSGTTPICDTSALHEWLYYGNPLGSKTMYRGIRQLLPAHSIEFDLKSLSQKVDCYWSIERQARSAADQRISCSDAVGAVRELLERGVARQLVADVPVGVFLSGGVDSSAIAAFASRHYAGRLATYSVGFDFAVDGGELPRARRVAAYYGTDHHEIHIAGHDVAGLVEKMVWHHDMPFSDAANIPLYLMAERIHMHTKVVLQGDGGDELFGGYRRYATLKYYKLLHTLASLMAWLPKAIPVSAAAFRAQRYMDAFAAEDLATTMALLLSSEDRRWNSENVFAPVLSAALAATDPFARFRELATTFSGMDIGNQMSLLDMSVILPDTYLEKVDRSTMATGLEVRVPFLDNDLVDFVVQLPGNVKMPLGRKKWLLKAALKGIVPDEVLFGPKAGFNVPFAKWLQTSMRALFFDQLNSFERTRPEILNIDLIRNLYARTSAGQQDHSPLLWKILNLLVWSNTTNVVFAA